MIDSKPGAKPSRMFSWKRGTDPQDVGVDFGDLNPEAIVIMSDADNARILILSDDGKHPGRGKEKTFRGVWLQQSDGEAAGANKSRDGGTRPPSVLREHTRGSDA